MEAKSASRLTKKSANAGPGTAGDKKKAKAKKKKEKRKASLKGTESTDVPSPELDSEVPFDGDVTLTDQGDGERSPAGQVTKLPHLDSSASVSLTTQPLPAPSLPSSQRKPPPGHTSSAPVTRTAVSIITSGPAATTEGGGVDGVVARVASLNIKQRSSKQRGKSQSSKANTKSSRARDRNNNSNNNNNSSSKGNNSGANAASSGGPASGKTLVNESLRWEFVLEDVEKERERIAMYKMNRRKRYLAAAQAKGLRWALNYNTALTVSPLSEDSGVDTGSASPPTAFLDFAPVTSLRPMQAHTHRGLQEAFVEC